MYTFIVLIAVALQSTPAPAKIRPSDILNVEYLPSTLLLEEATLDRLQEEAEETNNSSVGGGLKDAYITMQYHRWKMNEYMCRVYVADEILSGMGEGRLGRLGAAANHRQQPQLLADQGSSSYKDWLSRSTLLDDVYRHYDSVMSGTEEIESGEVTGYAVQGGGKTTGAGSIFHSGGGGGYNDHMVPGDSYGPPTHSYNPPHGGDEYYPYHGDESSGKSLALKDLFDLALTALAFLAFGVFIMNLIMTCMVGAQGTTIVMQTTSTTTTSTGDGGAKTRGKRSVEDELNHMAYRVSKSIETFLGLGKGKKDCLRFDLCKDNRYSRRLRHPHKIWMPLWSFGLSWVSGNFGGDRLANLRGAVLGLGAADCEAAYPNCMEK